jgi:protein gp37
MGENSGISWTDHTFNPWIGCTKVSPGCDNCYAERLATTRLGVPWGPHAERKRTTASWKAPRKWDRAAAKAGKRAAVFTASLADIFDNQVDPAWRADLFRLMKETPNLDWLVLTKRPQLIARMLPLDWDQGGYDHVHLGASVVVPSEVHKACAALLMVRGGGLRWLSCEPLLGDIAADLKPWLYPSAGSMPFPQESQRRRIDWVITGGESGPGARPIHPEWARALRQVCAAADVPFHFKQWGEWAPALAAGLVLDRPSKQRLMNLGGDVVQPGSNDVGWIFEKVGVDLAGRQLDGRIHDATPFGGST